MVLALENMEDQVTVFWRYGSQAEILRTKFSLDYDLPGDLVS